MPEYSATVEAWLRGATVNLALLATLDISTGPVRLWTGAGPLVLDGVTYEGERIVGLSGIEDAVGHAAPEGSITVSGVDDRFVAAALAGAAQVKGREITIAIQFFDQILLPYDDPDVLVVGFMDVPRMRGTAAERTVEIPFERDTARRALAPFGNWSDRDQQRLFPGDRGFEFMPTIKSKSVKLTPV